MLDRVCKYPPGWVSTRCNLLVRYAIDADLVIFLAYVNFGDDEHSSGLLCSTNLKILARPRSASHITSCASLFRPIRLPQKCRKYLGMPGLQGYFIGISIFQIQSCNLQLLPRSFFNPNRSGGVQDKLGFVTRLIEPICPCAGPGRSAFHVLWVC